MFNSKGQLVVEFLIRLVWWKVNAIETGGKKREQKAIVKNTSYIAAIDREQG